MKNEMRKYLFVGLICGIMSFNLAGCITLKSDKIEPTPQIQHYTMTSVKDSSKIIGSKGLMLIKINGKPGPLTNYRGLPFFPLWLKVYNKEKETFEVDLEPGEYTLEFDFYMGNGGAEWRANKFAKITLRVDRSMRYYLDFRSDSKSWGVYVSKVEEIF